MTDSLHILVIDDEPSIVELLSEYLRARGHTVRTASDGEQAMAVLEEHDPDLVLTDMKMPGIGGLELLEHIRGRDRFIGTILMTGYGTIDTAIRAMKNGALDYLLKPFKLREVHAAVIRAAERTRLERETVQLRQVVSLFETARGLEDPSGLDELYAHLATVATQELGGRGGLVAFDEPSVGRWVEACRTTQACFSGLDLQALGRAVAAGWEPGHHADLWLSGEQPLTVAPIRAQLRPGAASERVGFVAVVGGVGGVRRQTSLRIAADLVGDALARQVLGDSSRADGKRWGVALPDRASRAERLVALYDRMDTLVPERGRALGRRAAALHGELGFTTRGLLQGQLPGVRDLSGADARALREILLGVSERFDGDGSPRGLGGEAIGCTSRLLAIVDRWDLLTASRAYAPLLGPADASAALGAEAGSRLDPLMVERFLEMV